MHDSLGVVVGWRVTICEVYFDEKHFCYCAFFDNLCLGMFWDSFVVLGNVLYVGMFPYFLYNICKAIYGIYLQFYKDRDLN